MRDFIWMWSPSKESDSTSHSEKFLCFSDCSHFHTSGHTWITWNKLVYFLRLLIVNRNSRNLPFARSQKPVFPDKFVNNLFLPYIPVHCPIFLQEMTGFLASLLSLNMCVYLWMKNVFSFLLYKPLSVYGICS